MEGEHSLQEEKTKIAFSTPGAFQSAISNKEFESVLLVLKSYYSNIKRLVDRRQEVKEKAKEMVLEMKEKGMPDKEYSEAIRTSKALLWDADEKLLEVHGKELESMDSLTDFLNRFVIPGEELEKSDTSFINRIKEYNNGNVRGV